MRRVLRCGDIDWNEGRAVIIGKGNKQDVVRLTSRSMHAIKDYLVLRGGTRRRLGETATGFALLRANDEGTGKKSNELHRQLAAILSRKEWKKSLRK